MPSDKKKPILRRINMKPLFCRQLQTLYWLQTLHWLPAKASRQRYNLTNNLLWRLLVLVSSHLILLETQLSLTKKYIKTKYISAFDKYVTSLTICIGLWRRYLYIFVCTHFLNYGVHFEQLFQNIYFRNRVTSRFTQ